MDNRGHRRNNWHPVATNVVLEDTGTGYVVRERVSRSGGRASYGTGGSITRVCGGAILRTLRSLRLTLKKHRASLRAKDQLIRDLAAALRDRHNADTNRNSQQFQDERYLLWDAEKHGRQ